MAYLYYIDGYNVVHHSAELQVLARVDLEAARNALIDRVKQFCAATTNEAKIIFDGPGRAAPAAAIPIGTDQRTEVAFSSGRLSADTVIERAVYAAQNRRGIVVVSGDRGIRELCRALGAMVMSPRNFLDEVRQARRELESTTQYINESADGIHRVEHRLNGSSIARLERVRKRLGRKTI